MINLFTKIAHASYDFNQSSGLNQTAGKLGYSTGGPGFSPDNIIAKGISYLLSFLGIIFLVLAIYAGILWMTSQGNEKMVEKSKDILKNSLIGLIVVALAYAISYFVVSTFSSGYLN